MKILRRIPIVVTAILLVVFVAGCSGMKLDSPTGLAVDETKSVPLLTWNEVPDATYYKLNISSQNGTNRTVTVAKAYYSLLNIDSGDYVFKVQALDAKGNYMASAWSDGLNYVMQPSSGLVYTLTNANTEYVVSGIGTARGNVVVGNEYRGKPVTAIADRAFYGKSALTGITISANVKSIGKYAFTGCSNLQTVTFEGSPTTIGDYAFQSCSALTSIELPDSITEIGKYTFRYCRHLTSVKLGLSTTTIGEEAFMQCTSLAAIEFPDSVTYIGPSAFGSCEALTNVEIGKNVTEIGKSAFVSASSLERITFGKSLRIIGEGAFEKCVKLTSIQIPSNVTTISDSAFYDCTSLAEVTLGDGKENGITSIGQYAFYNTKLYQNGINGVYYVGNWVFDTDASVVGGSGKGDLTVRDGTVGIADSAFRNRKSGFESLYLPDTVKYIGKSAFRGCSLLLRIDLGNGVKVIGESAFRDCVQLGGGTIILGDSLEKIEKYAFGGCEHFGDPTYLNGFNKNFTLPSTVREIGRDAFKDSGFWKKSKTLEVYVGKWLVGYKKSDSSATQQVAITGGTIGIADYAFYKRANFNTVTIPESLKYIGEAAFAECSGLNIVDINKFCELEEIPDYAFYKCESLVDIILPSTVTSIGRSAFYKSGLMIANIVRDVESIGDYAYYGCEKLKTVNFEAVGNKLKSIGNYAFGGASSLETIALPDGVTTLGNNVFTRCTSLKQVELGNSLTSMGSAVFASCTSLKEVALPSTLKQLPERTFYKCSALTTVKADGITRIDKYAFYRCSSLSEVTLPKDLTYIGDYAFYRCGLKQVYIYDELTEMGAHVFNGNSSLTIYLQSSEIPDGWSARWNSAFRPTLVGCEFASDDDGTYVVSFTKDSDTLLNFNLSVGSSAVYSDPVRQGYVFGGWQADDGETSVVYTTNQLTEVSDGTRLIAIWNKIDD